jgi:cytochrome c-type biogenesis protein CcmH
MPLRRRLAALAILVLATLAGPAFAVQPDERLADPAQEARARALSAELRCLVCQNQSIDDSDAQLAKDLRVLVRERIAAGDSDGEVIDFLVARYGEFVLLKPRMQGWGWVVWLAPPALLALGGLGAWIAWRRRLGASGPAEDRLSAEEEAALQRLTDRGDNKAST